ncbi:MAG: hypothetical protein Q7R93_01315 [bacterium]|nr:hypothetical protein [bacterium]
MSTLNLGEMTLEEFRQKAVELDRLQKENWKKHFEAHPEQLLHGAEVCRDVSLEEVNLSAELICGCPSGPDDGEWTEVVDF